MAEPARVHVTDDPRRLAAWRAQQGEAEAETVALRDAAGRRRLRDLDRGARITVVLSALAPRAAQDLARPGVRRAAEVRLVALRGLARRVALDDALAALEPLGPSDANAVELDGLRGVAVTLTRNPAGAARLAALATIAAETASWDAAEAPVGPRVAVAGDAWGWADGLAGAAPVDPAWATDEIALRRAAPDVVVLGPGALADQSVGGGSVADGSLSGGSVSGGSVADGSIAGAVAAAHAAGAAVVAIPDGQVDGVATLHGGVLAGLAPIDPAAVPSMAAGPDGRGPGPVRVWEPTPDEPADVQARRLLLDAAHGHPVVATGLPPGVTDLLGDELAGLLASADPDELADDTLRERHGVRLRRAALATHSLDARWRAAAPALGLRARQPPAVSVLLATRRRSFLDHALDQIAGQAYRPLDLVVGLHGIAAPAEWVARARARLDGAVTTVEVDADAALGHVLNAAAAAATGELLTKMDDDDYYGPDHVGDLVWAHRSSAATLVGKGGEFYYSTAVDRTMRRVNDAREAAGILIAGNTLTIARSDLDAVGGWQAVGRGVDRRLVHDVLRAGGHVHRTHGFGHVVARHDDGHTWTTTHEELRRGALWERPGRLLDVADAAQP